MASLLVAAAVLASGTACSNRSSSAAAGDDVDFCTAYQLFDRLREPAPDSRHAVLTYADSFIGVIDRVDRRKEFRTPAEKRVKVSQEALDQLKTMRASLVAMRETVRSTGGDGAAVRAATNQLAADDSFMQADGKVTTYYMESCART